MPHERLRLRPARRDSIAQVARHFGIKPDTLRTRLRANPHWTISEAVAYRMPSPLADRFGANLDRTARENGLAPSTLRHRINAHPGRTLEELVAAPSPSRKPEKTP